MKWYTNLNTRRLKIKGKKVLKKHYWILVVLCLVAGFLGTQTSNSLAILDMPSGNNKISTKLADNGSTSTGLQSNQILKDLEKGDLSQGKKHAQEYKNKETKEKASNPALEHSKGFLSGMMNDFSSGTYVITIITALASVFNSESAAIIIFIFLALFLAFLFWVFVINIFNAVSCRIVLEAREYDKVPLKRFMFFARVHKWRKAAGTMLLMWFYQMLWFFTIVGGIIKKYSYAMVPYIVAENPNIKATEAIKLSRKMMDGHKWECFLFKLTFIGWDILGYLSVGLLSIFYVNPYKTAAMAEYYYYIRWVAKKNKIDGVEALNDTFLYQHPDKEIMEKAYRDEMAIANRTEIILPERKGFLGFLAKNFGLVFINDKKEKLYEEQLMLKVKQKRVKDVVSGKQYPGRLYPIPEKDRRSKMLDVSYLRNYSLSNIILLFFSFSFIGWIYEVSIHLIRDGIFVNRGTMFGPWLPIYGTGGVLMLLLLKRVRPNPVIFFFSSIVLCGTIEYGSSWMLEKSHNGMKWWDYSGYFLNINGRVCAEGLLMFAIGGLVIVYLLCPVLDDMFNKLSKKVIVPLIISLLLLFTIDHAYSKKHPNTGKGITDYAYISDYQEMWCEKILIK